MRAASWHGLIVSLVLASTDVAAQPPILARYTSDSGLAYDRVLRIVRDSRGFLWFCTAQGLSRFDGQSFRTYGVADGLPVAFVNDLLEARDGTYWVATNGAGVARFRSGGAGGGGRFDRFQVGDEHVTSEVYRLVQDARARVWAATMGGLFRLQGAGAAAGFASFPLRLPGIPDRSLRVWALAPGPDGSLWVGHAHGLSRVPADDGLP
jgi:ligand-binding sensor domain-containing protein